MGESLDEERKMFVRTVVICIDDMTEPLANEFFAEGTELRATLSDGLCYYGYIENEHNQ